MRGRWLPWALLAAWLVLAGISAPAGQKIREEVNDEYELPAGSQSAEIERVLRERFPGVPVRYLESGVRRHLHVV